MGKIARSLRIGEKIGFGFGLVGAVFLVVIWQYHGTLQRSLEDYRALQDIHVAKKVDLLTIQSSMREARRAEKDFLLYRDESYSRDVDNQLRHAQVTAAEFGAIDPEAAQNAERIETLVRDYRQKFEATVQAWRSKGLDHNSGLQGAFRNAVHELETMAGYFDVDQLYLQLLQIRRGEKDLGLRKEAQYRERVFDLLRGLENKTAASDLEDGVKIQLFNEIRTYRDAFERYAGTVLANEDIRGGKGPFRQAAHRIEAILTEHQVPDLASNILQLRRREKDYLLRDDKTYVDMALRELNQIHALVEPSAISPDQKTLFLRLLENYRRDFLALVEQNDLIGRMTVEMNLAVAEITELVEQDVTAANRVMTRMAAEIAASTRKKESYMLWSVAVATLLGILFAVSITLRIVRPLRSMAGLLDTLAYEAPAERLPFYPDGRDEVNSMAGSVNAMADNKAQFIAWWKNSMREASACDKLESALEKSVQDPAREEAAEEFKKALAARRELVANMYEKLHHMNQKVIEQADSLQKEGHVGPTQTSITTIRYSSRSMQTIMEMIAFQEKDKRSAA